LFGIGLILIILLLGKFVFATVVKPWEANQALRSGCKIVQHSKSPLSADDQYFVLLDFTRAAWLDGNYQNLALASAILSADSPNMGSLQTNESHKATSLLIDFCSKKK